MEASRPRARPAHTQGVTRCAYTPDGSRLVTVGSNNTIRLYKTGDDGEPTNIDNCQEQNVAVAVAAEFFVVGSEDGTVSRYSLARGEFDCFLHRCLGSVRDVALSPDARWCAVASDELSVKLVDTVDNTVVRTLAEHSRPTSRLAFDPKGSLLALSCSDGIIYVYSLTADRPELIRKIDAIIAAADFSNHPDARASPSCQVIWHPDARAFAAPTPTHDIQVVSKGDWEKQRRFADGHLADVTALAWSPNGALLASAGRDGKLLLWETASQSVIARHDFSSAILALSWHPSRNLISLTTAEGEVYIFADFVPDQLVSLLRLPRQPAPLIHHPLAETSGNIRRRPNGDADNGRNKRPRRESLGSINSLLGSDAANHILGHEGEDGDLSDFVVDDDGAGYVAPGRGGSRKRPAVTAAGADDDDDTDADSLFGGHGGVGVLPNKRGRIDRVRLHLPFQPGSTPWRGNRKYLCLNLVGFVWTVDQDIHHTVTVEFYDNALHRNFHFTDTFRYDKACLTHHGALFACPPPGNDAAAAASVLYRPHESWAHGGEWHITLPRGESVVAMSLTDSFVALTTSADYVRIYSLFGMPLRVYRPKSCSPVSCASWRDFFLTMGNGSVGPDGVARLVYSIEDLRREEFCQNEDTVALPPGATVKSVFFSDEGEPCIYDSTGTLLTLLHWRQPSKAVWVPILDTKLLDRLASGRKHESYYPVAVADNKFHCIILKGGDRYPYFPRPILSEFDFSVPISSAPKKTASNSDEAEDMPDEAGDGDGNGDDNSDESAESRRLEQQLVLGLLYAAQARDAATTEGRGRAAAAAARMSRLELEVDKTLLQLLAIECRAGEERGPRALELVGLMRDRSGRMVEAAGKVAARYGRTVLGDKIREIGERRIGAVDGDDDEDGAYEL